MAVSKEQEIKVEAIKSLKEIRRITANLSGHPRNLALFVVGINTNFRASDLLKIKVGDVRYLKAGQHFTSKEQKTGKERFTTINEPAYEAIKALLATMPNAKHDEPLFQSRKGDGVNGKGLSVPTFSVMVKEWCGHLRGNYGSHSLRKTFGYIQRTVFGVDIPTLMQVFNHSSQKQTLAYLGIQATEIKAVYMNSIK
ncbi:MAG: tyrosine-type recombinase/integrase [Desulfuromonadales bacterium]|nr:tyrosine-type recombinase/integrase [Desulfuromonadales bacterium]